jgi:choline dehydrogenase-like flavoprotein
MSGISTNGVAGSPDDVEYDAVVVGSGVSGAIVADQLARNGFHVLVLEAGPGEDMTIRGYEGYLSRFYAATSKDNNSPYPANPNAPMPRSPEVRGLVPGQPDASGYLVQNGPFPLDSTYTRALGGTTMHWEAKALRMLPQDFDTRTRFGHGLDWPVGYDDLAPHYRAAEYELGVSADVEDQGYLGITFEPGYVYPMRRLPASYLDQAVGAGVDGTEVRLGGESYRIFVRTTPQARNGVPHPGYDGGRGYVPAGAVSTHQVEQGERCQGNNNCVPICPAQAKYHAGKTLAKALGRPEGRVLLRTQAVASKVHVGPDGRVSHLEYRTYRHPDSPEHTTHVARARLFVLAANAVETPRLLLASGLPSSSGLVGRNLMDHAYLLAWGLMPRVVGTMRGSNCTSGIEDLRGGPFRAAQAAFRVSIHNDGWGWAGGTPEAQVIDLVDRMNAVGRALRAGAVDRISRQLLLDFMVEVLPDPANRITVDGRYRDALGNLRPVLSYGIDDYTLAGIAQARRVSRLVFQRLGVEDHTEYRPTDVGYIAYQGEGYVIRGGNHWAGTHVMGTSAATSVVDSHQRSWDHDNLYLVGAGSMPSIGTSNTTLTLAALAYRSAEQMVRRLRADHSPLEISMTGSARP